MVTTSRETAAPASASSAVAAASSSSTSGRPSPVDLGRLGGQRVQINDISPSIRRASGSIFTSARPLSKRQADDEVSHHGADRHAHVLTHTHTHAPRARAIRHETAHERQLHRGITSDRRAWRRRSWLRGRKLPGTRLRARKFYIFCRQIAFAARDFNISVVAAIFAFDSLLSAHVQRDTSISAHVTAAAAPSPHEF